MTENPDQAPIVVLYEDVSREPAQPLGEIHWIPGQQPTGTTPTLSRLVALRIEQHDGDVSGAMRELADWSNGYVRTRLSTEGPTDLPEPEPRCRHCNAVIEPWGSHVRHKLSGMVGARSPYRHNATPKT